MPDDPKPIDELLDKPTLEDGVIPEPETSPKPKQEKLGPDSNTPRDFASDAPAGGDE